MTYLSEIETLRAALEGNLQPGWITQSGLFERIDDIGNQLDSDLKSLDKSTAYIFSDKNEVESHTKKTIELFRGWITEGNAPTLSALCLHAMDKFSITDPKLRHMVLTCSFLGAIDNFLPYHSNMHYLKVTLQMIRMIAEHQNIYKDTSRLFGQEQLALMLATACIHDVGHDGKGNTLKGVYIPHRLEQNSFDIVKPVLKNLKGITNEMLSTIHLMLICTDVTPLNDPSNTLNQLKSAFRFHFLGEYKKVEALNLDPEIKALEDSPELTLMCLMMHEADIATSAGLHYNITKYETSLLMQEIGTAAARPLQIINFLNEICGRQMLTEVSQQLFAANLARIYALAEEDLRNGNLPYPRPEYSDFILGMKDRDFPQTGTSSKSIN